MTTELGGAVAVPSAVRNSDSTTTIRVNDVIITRIDGASDSTVNSAISWMMRSFRPPLPAVWPKLMLISCAASGVAVTISAATEAATVLNRTRRPHDASIRSWADGLTSLPSPVRGCRRAWSCPGLAWLRGALALALQPVQALAPPAAPADAPRQAIYAMHFRGDAPCPPGFGRRRGAGLRGEGSP